MVTLWKNMNTENIIISRTVGYNFPKLEFDSNLLQVSFMNFILFLYIFFEMVGLVNDHKK